MDQSDRIQDRAGSGREAQPAADVRGTREPASRLDQLLFLAVCVVWGLSWIPAKVGSD